MTTLICTLICTLISDTPCVGHAAQEISAIRPTAMVFVAGQSGGISHTPCEYCNPDASGNGTDVPANAVVRLINQA